MEWAALRAYAADQLHREPPPRTAASDQLYATYKEWCTARGLTNAEYVERYVKWDPDGVALEPSLSPYHLSPPTVQHWILWHHPRRAPGDSALLPGRELALVRRLLRRDLQAAGAAGAAPTTTGEDEAPLRLDAVCYQNVPALRSIPQIAHSHVFIRSAAAAALAALASRRAAWLARSPFLRGRGPTSSL